LANADFVTFVSLEDAPGEASASAPLDLQPQYVAVKSDGTTAGVTLQENEAIALIGIAAATATGILGLDARDFSASGGGLDSLDDGEFNIRILDA